jgi:hypothetical protein
MKASDCPVILEVIPPPLSWSAKMMMEWARSVSKEMEVKNLNYLNIPEIIDEHRNGDRSLPSAEKIDNVRFSSLMTRLRPLCHPIPNKIIGNLTHEVFQQWMESIYEQGIRSVVLIGPESHLVPLRGYTVEEGAVYIKKQFKDIEVGGVTIFAREHESKRIFRKMRCGVDFFFSQILFDTNQLQKVVAELSTLCVAGQKTIPKIFISLSPLSALKDIAFMKWLGVEFPQEVYSYLIEKPSEMQVRCFSVLERLIDEIYDIMKNSNIQFGFNIEHVRYTNLHLAIKLIDLIQEKERALNKQKLAVHSH